MVGMLLRVVGVSLVGTTLALGVGAESAAAITLLFEQIQTVLEMAHAGR